MGWRPYLNLVGPCLARIVLRVRRDAGPLPAENKTTAAGLTGALLGLGGFHYYVAGDTDLLADVPLRRAVCSCDGVYNMTDYGQSARPACPAGPQARGGGAHHYAGYIEGTDQNGPRLAQALNILGFPAKLLIGR